jgi:hypothetical protein
MTKLRVLEESAEKFEPYKKFILIYAIVFQT